MNVSMISADEIPVPRILSIGFSDDTAVTRFGPSRRKQYIIHYVLNGKGFFNGNAVVQGQGFLITPGIDEEYCSNPEDPWTYLWIISEDEAMSRYFDLYGADSATGIFEFHNK
jgi:AraC family transcriptional regulator of arabinose operon